MLFNSTDPAVWDNALALYPAAFKALAATKTDSSIIELDAWYQTEFPAVLAARSPKYITHDEIVKLVAWKLKRGKYRPALAKMVAEHADSLVRRTSQDAFDLLASKGDNLKAAITKMSELKGVGPATASAILCAGAPDKVPFMADESVDSVPGLGTIAYSLPYYLKFAGKVIEKADQLKKTGATKVNTPHLVELALWADLMADKFKIPRSTLATSSTSSSSTEPISEKTQKQTKAQATSKTETVISSSHKRKSVVEELSKPETTEDTVQDESAAKKARRTTRSSAKK
ncbi:hypothetical protein FBU30_003912 [Linnemannia zychae]|nr:hypothetical protein FBU30_003912 [Linnemannia zychae]